MFEGMSWRCAGVLALLDDHGAVHDDVVYPLWELLWIVACSLHTHFFGMKDGNVGLEAIA